MRNEGHRPYTKTESQAVIAMLVEGLSHRDIARQVGRNKGSISSFVMRNGLATRATPIMPAAARIALVHPERVLAGSVGDALPAFHPLAMAILSAPRSYE